MRVSPLFCTYLALLLSDINGFIIRHLAPIRAPKVTTNCKLANVSNRLVTLRNGRNGDDDRKEQKSLDEFLDSPMFDLDAMERKEGTMESQFATFVKNNYNKVEVVLGGIFIAFMVVVSMEILRMQMYGANYIPFTAGGRDFFAQAINASF
mmetsp:Transcript_33615/g.38942  ORF Transcript_33615/g.38942 Transcript_33615/m.38942 type:complete len:151 (-) Transcript_33615:192-644(-)